MRDDAGAAVVKLGVGSQRASSATTATTVAIDKWISGQLLPVNGLGTGVSHVSLACKRSSYSFIRKDEQKFRRKSNIHSPHFSSQLKSIPSSELAMPWTSERREAGRGGVENLTRGRWKCVS